MLAARVEPKNGPKNKKAGQILTAFGCVRFQRSEGLLFAEQVELPTVVVTFWRDGLVVTAYLGKVARLELQGDLHQGVRNVSGGLQPYDARLEGIKDTAARLAAPRLEARTRHPRGDRPRVEAQRPGGLRDRQALAIMAIVDLGERLVIDHDRLRSQARALTPAPRI